MDGNAGPSNQLRLSDDLSPVQQQRLRAAVRLMVEHLLDTTPLSRKNEAKNRDERRQRAAVPHAVQLRMEF